MSPLKLKLRIALVVLAAPLLMSALFSSCAKRKATTGDTGSTGRDAKAQVNEAEVDRALAEAVKEALGDREGAVLVMDPHSGRLRAVVNPRLAFEQAFPPGSTIKSFTALTAMRAGLIDAESRTLCRGRFSGESIDVVCSHPKSRTAFNLAQALGYSCNYFFATMSGRLSFDAFKATLASAGFGAKTGVNAAAESAGTLRDGEWRVRDLLGEGDNLLVTPIQLLTAYTALMNGGHLFKPQISDDKNFAPEERGTFRVDAEQRSALIQGMRGAVVYGTAEKAELSKLPIFIFGKTGTSTASNGFRRQGWFVSFASTANRAEEVTPESLELAVLVFLKRSHGSDAAAMSKRVFEEYAARRARDAATEGRGESETRQVQYIRRADVERGQHGLVTGREEGLVPALLSAIEGTHRTRFSFSRCTAVVSDAARSAPTVRVKILRENRVVKLALEDYVLGVVSVEASLEDQIEALKAQAIITRTYALKNLGRHASEGFDLCSNTHCQQYVERRASEKMRRAIAETAGEVLRDSSGQLVDAYFHAACGGMTANIETLWGAQPQTYLRGVRDDYCATMPNRNWVDQIPARRLSRALASGPQTDAGRIDDIVIIKRDATGRAELIAIEGERRRQVRGWDFKIIVGRTLGWNLLKSSRFTVARSGSNFIFRGSGFGHGLGLCQSGAHVMARRGASCRQILDHYFPGTLISGDSVRISQLSSELESGDFELITIGLPRPIQESLQVGKWDWSPPNLLYDIRNARDSGDKSLFPTSSIPKLHESVNPSQTGRLAGSSSRFILSSEHFRASYPATNGRVEVEAALRTLEAARLDMLARAGPASLHLPDTVELVIHETSSEFVAATGQSWWVAGVTRGTRIELQPLAVLRKRRILNSTLRHEYAHAIVETNGEGRTPRWLTEGLAIEFAGEGRQLERFRLNRRLTPDELERRLANPRTASEMRSLYAEAYREVRALIQKEGEPNIWRRIAQPRAKSITI